MTRLATETGAGQWGSALAMACTFFGLECKVYMVKVSFYQKPYRKSSSRPSAPGWSQPQPRDGGRPEPPLAENPDSNGGLGLAISEAVGGRRDPGKTPSAPGSVLNHVLLHQTIIGQEAKKQLDKVGANPDVVIGCVGGGSNFGGCVPFHWRTRWTQEDR